MAPGANITSYNSNIRVLQTYSDFEGAVQTTSGKNIQTFTVGRDFRDANAVVAGNIESLEIIRDGTGTIDVDGHLLLGEVNGHWGAHPVGSTPNYQSSTISVGGSISTSLTVSGDFIGELTANDALNVTIGGGFYDHVDGSNAIGSISITEDIDQLSIGVPVLGTATGVMIDLDADTVTNDVTFSGDFTAGSALLRDGLPAGTVFRIGQSLATGVVIEFENDPLDPNDVGLQGQVVINQNAGAGSWDGTVQVNDGASNIPLAPNYTTLSKDLGAGAAGGAPFNFHQFTGPAPASRADLDCNPWHTETLRVGPCGTVTDLEQVIIDHYGPVFADDAGGNYRIEFHPDFFPNSWSDASALFEVDTAQTDTADGGDNRKVVIVPAAGNLTRFNASGWFRFRPIAGKVKCANVAGNPDVAYDSSIVSGDLGDTTSGPQYDWYQFRVRLTLCRDNQILFENDQVNPSDIAAWMNEPFEVNMDGRVCQQDLADLLAAYDAQ